MVCVLMEMWLLGNKVGDDIVGGWTWKNCVTFVIHQ